QKKINRRERRERGEKNTIKRQEDKTKRGVNDRRCYPASCLIPSVFSSWSSLRSLRLILLQHADVLRRRQELARHVLRRARTQPTHPVARLSCSRLSVQQLAVIALDETGPILRAGDDYRGDLLARGRPLLEGREEP